MLVQKLVVVLLLEMLLEQELEVAGLALAAVQFVQEAG